MFATTLLALLSCAGYKETVERYPDHTLYQTRQMETYIALSDTLMATIKIGIHKLQFNQPPKTEYRLVLDCYAKGGLYIGRNDPLILYVDDLETVLFCHSSTSNINLIANPDDESLKNIYHSESADYIIDQHQSAILANAKLVDFVVFGKNRSVSGQINEKALETFQDFLKKNTYE
jgi:hypothetical protein